MIGQNYYVLQNRRHNLVISPLWICSEMYFILAISVMNAVFWPITLSCMISFCEKNFTGLQDHVSASLLIYFFIFEREILKLCELNFINTYNSQWVIGFNITFSFCCFRGVITYTLHFTWFRFPLRQPFSVSSLLTINLFSTSL